MEALPKPYVPPHEFVAPILHQTLDMDPAKQPHVVLFETARAPEFGIDFREEPPIDPVQRYGRDTARIPTQGNIPGKPLAANLVALNNLGNPAVGLDSVIMASATHFWQSKGIEAGFYNVQVARNTYGFRASRDFLALIGIANAQRMMELGLGSNHFQVTAQHVVEATARVIMQRARLLIGEIDERTMN